MFERLASALDEGRFVSARQLVRAFADLVNAGVLLPDAIGSLFESLLDQPQVLAGALLTF